MACLAGDVQVHLYASVGGFWIGMQGHTEEALEHARVRLVHEVVELSYQGRSLSLPPPGLIEYMLYERP